MKQQQDQTKIPLGLNRYALVAVACVFCLLNGPVVLNWVPIRSQLTKSDVYAWLCNSWDEFDEDDTCGDQRKAIALLSTLASTLMFVGAVFAGFVADTFGPRTATTCGSLMFALHYLMLGVSSQSFQLYIPAYIFNGLAIEMSFFGLLSIANLFPSNQSFALSVMGTFRSISMAYGLLQNAITVPDKFNIRATSFLCMAIALGLAVLAFFVLPNKNFLLIKAEEQLDLEAAPIAHKEETLEGSTANLDDEEDHSLVKNNHSLVKNNHSPVKVDDDKVNETSQQESEKAAAKAERKLIMREAWAKARKLVYIAFVCYFALAYARGSFYNMSINDQHRDVTDAFAILSPLSFIPCPFLGYLADTIGMLWVLLGLNTVGTIMFICLASGSSLAAQWIAVFGSMILFSFLASQNYCYVTGAYSERIAGKLAGFAMLCAGLFAFVNTPLYNWATDSEAFRSVDFIYVGVSAVLYCLLGYMWLMKDTTRSSEEDKVKLLEDVKTSASVVN